MFGSEILEVAIGFVFIILVASLVASTLREMVEAVLKTRAIQLERGLRQLLDDEDGTGYTQKLFDHPLLYGLFAGKYDPTKLTTFVVKVRRGAEKGKTPPKRIGFFTDLPAYIPSRNFALALLHTVGSDGQGGSGVLSLDQVKANALTLQDGKLKQAMLVALGEAENDLDRARTSLEAWFDGTMDRVSGWYKRETQWILLSLGLVIAVTLNIDSLSIVRDLATNNSLRQAMIARVDANYANVKTGKLSEADLQSQLQGLSDLIGWSTADSRYQAQVARALFAEANGKLDLTDDAAKRDWVKKQFDTRQVRPWYEFWLLRPLGWLLTALAISLGAPFWFDLLNKLMVIRSTVKPYEKSPAEGSEDRAGSGPSADRLAPLPGAAAAPAPALNAVAGDAPPTAAAPQKADIRLAIDQAGLAAGSLQLTRNGFPVAVPQDGFVELSLETGVEHSLEVKGKDAAGAPVTRSRTVTPTLDNESEPMTL